MSLATRCTACGTAFRVVQDQLRVSEGWVRCGRCGEVFNAIEGLFDLERDVPPSAAPGTPPSSPPGAVPPAPVAPAAQFLVTREAEGAGPQVHAPAGEAGPPSPERAVARPAGQARAEVGALGAPAPSSEDADSATAYEVLDSRFLDQSTYRPERHRERGAEDFADARFDSELNVHPPHGEHDAAPADGPEERSHAEEAPGRSRRSLRRSKVRTLSDATPEFLRRAERAQRWHHPAVRFLLGLAAFALTLSLAAQVVFHFRDTLAVRQPALAPWLAQACDWVGCEISAPRRIDDVVVDSSSLTRLAAIDGYRLTVLVRNRGQETLAMPWIDLNLTDTEGRLVARRSLDPATFRASPTLGARQDATLTLEFTTPGHRIAGYTVEAFYP
ncbi:MAG: zinc-ribbon and DUF3426 domain-containing protein [Pseudomonadota bacterium]